MTMLWTQPTETLHGVEVADPYRWLEDSDSEATREWIKRQGDRATLYLNSLPGRAKIRARVEELLREEVISEPWKIGRRFFYLKRKQDQQQACIMTRPANAHAPDSEILLVDPNREPDATTAVNILAFSHDGKLLAYCARRGGEDSCVIRLVNTETGTHLPDSLPPGSCGGVVIANNGEGFYYVHRPAKNSAHWYSAVRWHRLGSNTDQDIDVFVGPQEPGTLLGVSGSLYGQRLGISVVWVEPRRSVDFYVFDPATSAGQKVVEQVPGLFMPVFTEGKLIALTDWNAPNGRVVAIDLSRPERENWLDLVPETDCRIEDFRVAGHHMFVGSVENGMLEIRIHDMAGRECGVLPSPRGGTPQTLPCHPESEVLFYKFSSFARPPAIMCYHPGSQTQEVWAESGVLVEPDSVEVKRSHYLSKDGTRVPILLA
jgi:prolyl oligopeptidase